MIKNNHLNSSWLSQWQSLTPNVISHMISETLFPRKIETLGSVLLVCVFLLLLLMIQGIIQASFEALFLALIVTILGVSLWVVSFTGYLGNIRA